MHVASNQDITAGMSEAKSNLKSEKKMKVMEERKLLSN